MKRVVNLFFIAFMLLAVTAQAQDTGRMLELRDIWASREFIPNRLSELRSMKDGEHYTLLENNAIEKYQYKTGKKLDLVVDGNLLKGVDGKKLEIAGYTFDKNEQNILIETEPEQIYRHSSRSFYYVYNIKNQTLLPVSRKGKQQLADFSPDGSKVAFVRDNNLIIAELSTGFETAVTTDGLDRHIINGTTDWVYEEEFSFTKGFFWSPDGSRIAFYRFDESAVKEFWMTTYGSIYPEKYKFKYPKAGEDNSKVSIHVYSLADGKTQLMDTGKEIDQYIPRIQWTKSSTLLSIQRMNRLQNKLEILLADATNGTSKVIYTEENKYYIDITDNLYFIGNNDRFVISSERNGFNQLYLIGLNGEVINLITQGNFDVSVVYGIDEKSGHVFYQAAETSPMNREVYSVKLDGSGKMKLSSLEGTNSADFSAGYKYFINTWSDANTPPVYTLHSRDGKKIKDLETNAELQKKLSTLSIGKKEFITFKTGNGDELNGWMMKPADFNPRTRYPVLMYVYGGPGSQTVNNSWGWFDFLWFHMLNQKGYIVVSVDGRGTGFRGEEFKKCTYLQLGKFETEDQIETAKYLGTLDYIDSKRIGIFGWSYGGYMSSLCMTQGAAYFKAGIAVAPVTNWRYYDNIYTERFMRTHQENGKGYDDNSPITHVRKLSGKYLIVHGTSDDNVHVENTIEMVDALVKANKQFDMFLYPNRDHGIRGGATRLNLYTKMTDFLLQNL